MAKLRQLDPNGITWHAMAGYPRLENLATNPSFETVNATPVDIFRNLANNPSFEAANGLTEVRRNNALNPFGIGTSTGYGQQTVTPNVAISGHPEGLTTATRVSYITSNSTAGVTFNSATSVNTEYTVSAWIYHEVNSGNNFGFAQQEVLDGPSITAAVGTWVRASWTFTSHGTNTASIGFRLNGTAVSDGSFLITGMLLEKTSRMRSFFGGSTPDTADLTHAWTGASNASESLQNGDRIADATLSRVAAYRSKSHVKSGSYSAALESLGTGADSYIAPGGDGGIRLGLQGGKTYTFLATITTPITLTSAANVREKRIVVFYLPTGGTYVETRSEAGPTTGSAELRLTITIPTDISEAFVRLYHGARVAGEKVYWDNFAIIEGTYTGPYFDGDTLASGDFTYAWAGTPHASQSIQRGTVVTGTTASTSTGAFFKTYRHTTETGETVARYFVPKTAGTASWRIAAVHGMDYSRIIKGRTYTLYVRFKGSQALSATTIAIGLMDGNTANKILPATTGIPVTTGWSTWSKTFVAENTSSNATVLYPSISTIDPPDDFFFDIAEWMLVEGHAPPHKYFDGSTPEDVGYIYSWAGPANASTSIALPK